MYTTMRWWRLAGCEPSYAGAGCGTSPHGHGRGYGMRLETRGHGPHGGMGVRRPLRFLAWKLELDEEYYQDSFRERVARLAPTWKALGITGGRRSFSEEIERLLAVRPSAAVVDESPPQT